MLTYCYHQQGIIGYWYKSYQYVLVPAGLVAGLAFGLSKVEPAVALNSVSGHIYSISYLSFILYISIKALIPVYDTKHS